MSTPFAPVVRQGLAGDLGSALVALGFPPGPCMLVTDRTVRRLHGAAADAGLRRAGFTPTVVAVPPGERSKSSATLLRVLDAMARARAGRDEPVVALGGGVVTDLAGFAAAVWARGVPWVAVPTTVMGLADAAVGGKTGIDLPAGKNLVGAFHAPRAVLADPDTLRTLPPRHRRNGLAEVAKTALLAGVRPGLPRVRRLAGVAGDAAALAAAAVAAAVRKAAIVRRDPLETRGLRVVLNLGHTTAHALEAATDYDGTLLHGEAVAVGLAVEARLAVARGLLAGADAVALDAALEAAGLAVRPPRGIRRDRIARALGMDKKRVAGRLRAVLPRTRGAPVAVEVEAREILAGVAAALAGR